MAVVYFISVDELKKRGFVHDNVDTKILKQCILRAQDMNIQQAIGTPLYKALKEMVETSNVVAPYADLMEDFVQPALVAWTDERASVHLITRLTNKTTGKNSDEYITSVDRQAETRIKDRLTHDAEFYTQRLIGHLQDNCKDYPEYNDYICKKENVRKRNTGYSKGFY